MGKIQVTAATTAKLPHGIQKSVRLDFPEDKTEHHKALTILLPAEEALEIGKSLVELAERMLRQP